MSHDTHKLDRIIFFQCLIIFYTIFIFYKNILWDTCSAFGGKKLVNFVYFGDKVYTEKFSNTELGDFIPALPRTLSSKSLYFIY